MLGPLGLQMLFIYLTSDQWSHKHLSECLAVTYGGFPYIYVVPVPECVHVLMQAVVYLLKSVLQTRIGNGAAPSE